MIRLCYSNRAEELVDALAEDLAAAAGRTLFDRVPLVVPGPQLEAYVKMGVASRNGVVANLAARYLRGFLIEVAAASAPDVVIVDRAAIEGELLALFHDERRLQPGDLGPVRDYLAAGGDGADAVDLRRFQLSAELAALFDDYAFSRPEMLQAWRAGRLEPGLDESLQPWQRALWLALFGRRGAFEQRARDGGRRHLALPAFFEELAPGALRAPDAAYVFGISYVARLYRRIFAALGQACALHIYTLNPCREFWEDLEPARARRPRAADRARFPPRRQPEQMAFALPEAAIDAGAGAGTGAGADAETPALALWARPGRENIRLLNQLSDCDFAARFRDPLDGGAPATLLAQLQRDILDRAPARRGDERLALAGDGSVTILPCPDPRRELETIAAEIWELARRDDELRFSDVAVIVPDSLAATYLPLAAAVLREASDLPHAIIEAPPGGESRVVEAIGLLLALPLGALGRQDLLRLAMHPTVAARFPDADPDDWLRLCEALDVVHGADSDDHAGTYVDADRFNWDQGLGRLSLGAFLAGARSGEERAYPLGGERYLPAELAPDLQESAHGFAILARSLIAFARRARGERLTVAEWVALYERAIASTVLAGEPEDEQALVRVFGALAHVAEAAPPDLRVGYRIACELARAALGALSGRRGQALAEGVTVSTFLPVRALPFRVVFVAGMGEGCFPAADRAAPLDLRAGRRLPGDVTAREQDQYLFLETLLSARERLYLSYVGRDPVTGEEIAPASTVRELGELLEAGYLGGRGVESITRPAPPHARHEDDAACAVIPAAARERRAAMLGRSLREALGGHAAPEWNELRERLSPATLAAVAPALGWIAPPPAPASVRLGSAPRRLTLAQLLRFLQCPLQGSARALLPFGDDDGEEAADAAYREHEDFEAERARAPALLRETLAAALRADPSGGDEALARAYDEAATIAALDGTLPAGRLGAAARDRHLDIVRGWRTALARAGGGGAEIGPAAQAQAPAPIWFGHAPEHRRDLIVAPAPTFVIDVADGADGGESRRITVELHGSTQPLAIVGGLPASITLVTGSTRLAGNGRDFLRGWIDHVALAAAGHEAPDGRRALVVRAGAQEAEDRRAEEIVFAPLAAAEARAYLAALATELLGGVHAYFLPCEAILGWCRKPEPRPGLAAYTLMLRDDGWTSFTSDWGPVRQARGYSTPPEPEAQAIMQRRFGPFLASRREPAGGKRGGRR